MPEVNDPSESRSNFIDPGDVIDIIAGLEQEDKVLIEVTNETAEPLVWAADEHSSGEFARPPSDQIEPGETDRMVSVNTGLLRGSEGFIRYRIGSGETAAEWIIEWSNPERGDNSADNRLVGDGAPRWRGSGRIGATAETAEARYVIRSADGSGPGGTTPGAAGANSCVVTVYNQSTDSLMLADQGHDRGGFENNPAMQIPPGETDTFESIETPGDPNSGCAGFVEYHVGQPGQCTWRITWDNPNEGDNRTSYAIDGATAEGYTAADQITADKANAATAFAIYGSAAPGGTGPGGTGPGEIEEVEYEPPGEADEPTLRKGDVDADGWVEYLQSLLNLWGAAFVEDEAPPTLAQVTPIAEDGHFGDGTERAVWAFQTDKGLMADTIVGNQTWSALRQEPPQPPSTDGRQPHTYSEVGPEARWVTDEIAVRPHPPTDAPEAMMVKALNVGDVALRPGDFLATARITSESGEQHTVNLDLDKSAGVVEPGDLFQFIYTEFKQDFGPGTYQIEAYMPAELGGDECDGEFTMPE